MEPLQDYNQPMRLRWLILVVAGVAVVGLSGVGLAIDFKKEMAPRRWPERLVPEDLPPLTYPEFFNDVDKARAQLQGGRYRLSLVTLAKAKDADQVEAALVRANSL